MKKTNQNKVLLEIYREKRPIDIDGLTKLTELKRYQVYNSINDLVNRKLIIKNREKLNTGYKNPPYGKITVVTNENVKKRIKKILFGEKNDK